MICSEEFSHLTHRYVLWLGSLAPDRGEEELMGLDGGDSCVMIRNGGSDLLDGAKQVILWMGCAV